MALNGCSSGLLATALLALLLLPAQYYVPELREEPPAEPAPRSSLAWLEQALAQFPPLDLFVTVTLLLLGLVTYLCEWIQRKIMERRIVKLNQYLGAGAERLRARDAQQEQLEATLRLVRGAAAEYRLLLLLLLRRQRCLGAAPPSNCFLDKGLDDASFLSPTVEI